MKNISEEEKQQEIIKPFVLTKLRASQDQDAHAPEDNL